MLLAIFVICFFAFCLFVIIKANLKPNTRKGDKCERKFIRNWDDGIGKWAWDDEYIFDKEFGFGLDRWGYLEE